jgi:hypothetical protein
MAKVLFFVCLKVKVLFGPVFVLIVHQKLSKFWPQFFFQQHFPTTTSINDPFYKKKNYLPLKTHLHWLV